MANTFPVGHIRINPNTYMSEVWNGSKWIDTATPQMVNTNTYTMPIGSANGITSSTVTSTTLRKNMEDVYEFLKHNLRVAEYRDGNGKIETVELQLRLDTGYEWESIKRTKITRTKL